MKRILLIPLIVLGTAVQAQNVKVINPDTQPVPVKVLSGGGGGGGSGTVTNTGGSLTANSVVLGAGTVDTKVLAGFTTDGTSKLTLGSGTNGGKLTLNNSSGTGAITLQPTAGAATTVTFEFPADIGGTNTVASRGWTTATGVPAIVSGTGLWRSSGGTLFSSAQAAVETDLAFTDVTTNNASSTQHGLLPKTPGDATKFLNGANPPAFVTITPRSASTATSATPTPNADTTDLYILTALTDATATFGAPTGTPVAGQKLMVRITDSGGPRTLAWNSGTGGYSASTDLALPLTTTASKTMYLLFIYNATGTAKWNLLAKLDNF